MAQTQTVTITCDLCGYGGPYSRPEDFPITGDVDLCHWCATDPKPLTRMTCGRHDITFADDWSWTCSCGERWVPWMHVRNADGTMPAPKVVAAVPNYRFALARIHSERVG